MHLMWRQKPRTKTPRMRCVHDGCNAEVISGDAAIRIGELAIAPVEVGLRAAAPQQSAFVVAC